MARLRLPCLLGYFLAAAILLGALLDLPAADEKNQVNLAANKPSVDWPIFRGNALQTGIAVAELPEKLEIRWKFKTKDAIESTAAIVNGVVYVGSLDEHLYAIDLAKGAEKWKYKAGPIKAPVSYHKGAIYAGDIDGMFHSVDAVTGKKRWSFETEAEILSGANFAGDAVLFGSYDENLYSLSNDGKLLWKFKTQGPVVGSPTVIGDRTFVAGCDSSLHILDTTKGQEIKAVELGGQSGATAAGGGDRVYVGTMSNQVLAIDWKKADVVWTYEPANRQQPFFASAAVTDQLIITGSRDKRVHALDRQTGKEAWTFTTDGRVDSSPVVVGKKVYIGSLDGNLYVLDLAKGTLLAKYDLGGPISASPAVSGDSLVIGTEKGMVYCFGAKK